MEDTTGMSLEHVLRYRFLMRVDDTTFLREKLVRQCQAVREGYIRFANLSNLCVCGPDWLRVFNEAEHTLFLNILEEFVEVLTSLMGAWTAAKHTSDFRLPKAALGAILKSRVIAPIVVEDALGFTCHPLQEWFNGDGLRQHIPQVREFIAVLKRVIQRKSSFFYFQDRITVDDVALNSEFLNSDHRTYGLFDCLDFVEHYMRPGAFPSVRRRLN